MVSSAKLEDLVDIWNKNYSVINSENKVSDNSIQGILQKKINNSNSRIRKNLAIEVILIALLFLFSVWVIKYTWESISIFGIVMCFSSFLVILLNMFMVLESYLLDKKTDYSINLKQSIETQLRLLKKINRYYLFCSILFGLLFVFLAATAIKFPQYFFWFNKVLILLYFVQLIIVSRPYFKWRFGMQIKQLEEQLLLLKSL